MSLATAHLMNDCDLTEATISNASEFAQAGRYNVFQDATGQDYLNIQSVVTTKRTCSQFGYKAIYASCAEGMKYLMV